MSDILKVGGKEFSSRLFLGTGKFSDTKTMIAAVKASGTELVTVALRRFNRAQAEDDLYGPLTELSTVRLMPNTSGTMNTKEAVRAAMLGRELSKSPIVKLEIHPNPHHLLPEPIETYEAAIELVKQDFIVLPYIPADPILTKRLEDIGCAAVMPLGAAIGTGKGLSTADMIKIIGSPVSPSPSRASSRSLVVSRPIIRLMKKCWHNIFLPCASVCRKFRWFFPPASHSASATVWPGSVFQK